MKLGSVGAFFMALGSDGRDVGGGVDEGEDDLDGSIVCGGRGSNGET